MFLEPILSFIYCYYGPVTVARSQNIWVIIKR